MRRQRQAVFASSSKKNCLRRQKKVHVLLRIKIFVRRKEKHTKGRRAKYLCVVDGKICQTSSMAKSYDVKVKTHYLRPSETAIGYAAMNAVRKPESNFAACTERLSALMRVCGRATHRQTLPCSDEVIGQCVASDIESRWRTKYRDFVMQTRFNTYQL